MGSHDPETAHKQYVVEPKRGGTQSPASAGHGRPALTRQTLGLEAVRSPLADSWHSQLDAYDLGDWLAEAEAAAKAEAEAARGETKD